MLGNDGDRLALDEVPDGVSNLTLVVAELRLKV
jgi:hypothetical protein